MLPQLENLARVAAALRGIPERFVFAGAGILPLLLDAEYRGPVRGTNDTDLVVPVLHYGEWARLRDALVPRGFRERADVAVPRQILFWLGDLAVDFIPARMKEFGTENRWLSLGFDLAEPHRLESGEVVLRLPASAWLAAKCFAFEQRGRQDPLMSRDLDDIVTLLAGRAAVVRDVRRAPPEMCAFIEVAFREWRRQPLIWDAMDACTTDRDIRAKFDAARRELAA